MEDMFMANFVAPVVASNCIGSDIDGNVLYYLLCKNDANDTEQCVTMQLFYAACGINNYSCNSLSSAFVPSVTVCNQNLYTS